MKNIYIVNAFGFGREVAEWISLMPGYGAGFQLAGFLDDRPDGEGFMDLTITGNPADFHPGTEDLLVIALSDPAKKAAWARHFKKKNAGFFSVIHPSNRISGFASVGEACILAPFNSISTGVVMDSFVTLYGFCRIGHDARLESFCHLSSHVAIGGGSTVKSGASIPEFTTVVKNQIYE